MQSKICSLQSVVCKCQTPFRALSDVESRYSQTETDAIVWGVKCHLYLCLWCQVFHHCLPYSPHWHLQESHANVPTNRKVGASTQAYDRQLTAQRNDLKEITTAKRRISLHERYNSWCVSLPSSTKHRVVITFCIF